MRIPRHIGDIPDGNRRWATLRQMEKKDGYQYGLEPGMKLLKKAKEYGVEDATNKVAFCLSCGVPIRSGKYCNLCQSRMAGKASGEKGVYNAVADGTIDKQKGQMRFK